MRVLCHRCWARYKSQKLIAGSVAGPVGYPLSEVILGFFSATQTIPGNMVGDYLLSAVNDGIDYANHLVPLQSAVTREIKFRKKLQIQWTKAEKFSN